MKLLMGSLVSNRNHVQFHLSFLSSVQGQQAWDGNEQTLRIIACVHIEEGLLSQLTGEPGPHL